MTLVRYEASGDAGEIVLDSPPLNLFGPDLIADLEAAVARAADERPRALLVRADGDVFSAGADVHVFDALDADGAARLTGRLLAITHAVEDLPFPTVAVAHGLCLTAGLELSLACDLPLAGEGVRFGLVEAVVGITPLMGGTQRIAERAGPARARELVMTGELFDAETLHAWGVVNRVLPADRLRDEARRLLAGLAAGPTLAHGATKRIVRAQVDSGTRGADARTAEYTSHLFETADCRNAVHSFLAAGPGKASFTGS
jgi:enoyl-CoA hydratase/carnithine racemase